MNELFQGGCSGECLAVLGVSATRGGTHGHSPLSPICLLRGKGPWAKLPPEKFPNFLVLGTPRVSAVFFHDIFRLKEIPNSSVYYVVRSKHLNKYLSPNSLIAA